MKALDDFFWFFQNAIGFQLLQIRFRHINDSAWYLVYILKLASKKSTFDIVAQRMKKRKMLMLYFHDLFRSSKIVITVIKGSQGFPRLKNKLQIDQFLRL